MIAAFQYGRILLLRIKYVEYLFQPEMLINVQLWQTYFLYITPKLIKLQWDCIVWCDNKYQLFYLKTLITLLNVTK